MSTEPIPQQIWSLLLQVGSLSGLIAGLSLVYTILFNRVRLKIDVEYERVNKNQDSIELSIKVRNPSPRRDTSIESSYLTHTSRHIHERLWSPRLLTLFETTSIMEVIVDKKEAVEKLEAVGRNIRIRAGTTRSFRVLFSRPHFGQYSQIRWEGRWRRYWPIKLVLETTHKDLIIPVMSLLTRQQAEDVERWFFELWRG